MFPSLFWASTSRIQQFAGGWMGAVFTSCSANSLYCLHNNDVTAQGQGPQLAIHFQYFHCFTSSSMRRRRKINNRSWDFSPFFSWIDFSISSINVKTRWLYLVFSKFAKFLARNIFKVRVTVCTVQGGVISLCSISAQTCRETTFIISECNLTLAALSLRAKLTQVNLQHLLLVLHNY